MAPNAQQVAEDGRGAARHARHAQSRATVRHSRGHGREEGREEGREDWGCCGWGHVMGGFLKSGSLPYRTD